MTGHVDQHLLVRTVEPVRTPEVCSVRRIGVDVCQQRHRLRLNLPWIRELTPSRQSNVQLTQTFDGRASTLAVHNLGLNAKTYRPKTLNSVACARSYTDGVSNDKVIL